MNKPTDRRSFVKGLAIGTTSILAARTSRLIAAPAPKVAERFLGVFDRAAALNLEFADAMPDDKYGFRPVPEIRSYAEQMLHIAGSDVFFVSSYIVGGDPPDINFEPENPTKPMVKELMNASDEYVRTSVSGLTDEQMGEMVETFAGDLSKEGVLWFMRDHITHTRGQAVIYLRLNGIVPPQYVGT